MSQIVIEKKGPQIEQKSASQESMILKLNALRYVQKKMEEAHRSMAYVQYKFNELGIESNLPAHVSLDMQKINVIAKKEEKKLTSY